MEREIIIKKVIARLEQEQVLKKDIVNFIKNKLKIKIPSKDKALKILKKMVKNPKDVEKAYDAIPSIFKMKLAISGPFGEPKETIKHILILSAIIALFEGALPVNPKETFDILHREQIKREKYTFDYLGELDSKNIKKVIDEEDSLWMAKKKIKIDLMKDNELKYKGKKPARFFELYKDARGSKFKNVKELFNWNNKVYLGKE